MICATAMLHILQPNFTDKDMKMSTKAMIRFVTFNMFLFLCLRSFCPFSVYVKTALERSGEAAFRVSER